MNPSLSRIAVEQMGVMLKELIEKGHFFLRKALIELPLIGGQYAPRGGKARFGGPLKVNFHGLYAVFLNDMGMGDFGFICQGI